MKYIKYILIIFLVMANSSLTMAQVPAPEFNHTRHYKDFQIKDNFDGIYYPRLASFINNLKPNVGVETYHQFEIPAQLLENKTDEEIDRLLYATLTSFNTQEGIEYFSHRRQKYRLFIEKSYRVFSVEDRAPLDDIELGATDIIPKNQLFYVYQMDTSFGDGIKQVDTVYDEKTHQFSVRILNREKIKYQGFFPIADPEEFVLYLLVKRDGNKIRMYGITASQVRAFKSLRNRISISIAYRIYSLTKWYETKSIEMFSE